MSRTWKDSKKGKQKLSNELYWLGPIPSSFKKMRKKIRRAKEKNALKNKKIIPIFRRCDGYDFW